MNRWTVILAALLMLALVAMGCSKGNSPVSNDLTGQTASSPTQSHLWGFYDVYVDIPSQTATAVLNRNMMFAANVVQFVNGKAANLKFTINGTPVVAGGGVDVDIDVAITHPFAGLTQYNGYDVRGIFVADGSSTMAYNTKLKYAKFGTDQVMYDYAQALTPADPHTGLVGNPDGYTRWFNPSEFNTTGLFGYTKGLFASAGYTATATLNPYKYFADTLAVDGSAFTYITTTTNKGVFSAGTTNTRNYYLRFPTMAVKFGYAIVTNWKGELPADHPSNAPEACALSVKVTPDLYWASAGDKGGKLKVDMSFPRTWGSIPSTIFTESDVLTTPYQLSTPELVPVGTGTGFSTYHVEIAATNLTSNSSSTVKHEFWVIPQYDGFDYKNTFSVTNGAGTDKLAAFFRYDLFISPTSYNKVPSLIDGVVGQAAPAEGTVQTYDVYAYDPDGDTLTYSWTVKNKATGVPLTGYNGISGNAGANHLSLNFAAFPWMGVGGITIDCTFTDGKSTPVSAVQKTVTFNIDQAGDVYVSNNAAFTLTPTGSKTAPYKTINAAVSAFPTSGKRFIVDYSATPYTNDYFYLTSSNQTVRAYPWSIYGGTRPVVNDTGSYGAGYVCYYGSAGNTVQGFTISCGIGYTQQYLVYFGSNNNTLKDCVLTGTNSSTQSFYAIQEGSMPNTIVNNKITKIFLSYSASTSGNWYYVYGLNCNSGYSNHYFNQNEITDIISSTQTIGNNYLTIYGVYEFAWTNTSYVKNNLIHHLNGKPNASYYANVYPIYNSGTYNYAGIPHTNNTIDKIDVGTANVNGLIYGIYLYDSSGYPQDIRGNIMSNFTGPTGRCYGIYKYYAVSSYPVGYNCGYNLSPNYYIGSGEVPNTTNVWGSDPKFVNNTTAPYDYHLATGSPCIGTFSGADMGAYGNLASGQTVGLLTNE